MARHQGPVEVTLPKHDRRQPLARARRWSVALLLLSLGLLALNAPAGWRAAIEYGIVPWEVPGTIEGFERWSGGIYGPERVSDLGHGAASGDPRAMRRFLRVVPHADGGIGLEASIQLDLLAQRQPDVLLDQLTHASASTRQKAIRSLAVGMWERGDARHVRVLTAHLKRRASHSAARRGVIIELERELDTLARLGSP